MLHALVDNMPAGVFFVQGPQGRPILVNARARQLLGQREDASLSHASSVYRLHRRDGSPYPVDELPVARALRHGRRIMSDDVVVHRPDGRHVSLVTWAAPVALAGTSVDAAVWVLEDLTALHQAEATRREAESRLNAVVDAMGVALLVLDHNGEIVEANAAAASLFGTENASLVRRRLTGLGWSYIREDGRPIADEDFPSRVVLGGGRPVRGMLLGLRREDAPGLLRWVLVHAMPLGSPATGAVLTFADISSWRQQRDPHLLPDKMPDVAANPATFASA
jgi:PAS domain S-box-containing protein